ncbi:hypothetical protein [Hymenobacter metallicola]|uniref:DUF3592 domain-containing protein n=1 Tax=Hymenobacter metallicola TaxID=2563114 RepID=A0A4Z0PZP9_9BACT|nr:hypothetical protein [Hymenobacter metallicola]TGE23197.1 hypothetical protein E5K02_18510 [Hymenobacter metallicola]
MHRLLNQYGLLLLLNGGLALIFLLQLPESWRITRVVEQGRVVPVEVIHGSTVRLGNRAQSYLDFRYAGRSHSVRVSHALRQRVKGAPTIDLLHLPEYPDLFLPPDYNDQSQSNSLYGLLVMFLGFAGYCLFMLIKKRSD